MNEQLLKTPGADVLSSRKKSEKPYGGGGELASPLHVRPVKLLCDKFKDSLIKIGKNEISRKSKKSSLRLNRVHVY